MLIAEQFTYGILAQLGEHLPYKQRVIGSIPIAPTIKIRIHSIQIFLGAMRHHSQVVRQRPAKPLPPVRVWVVPPFSPVMPKWRNTPLALRGVRYARLRADADNDLKSFGSISPSGGMADAKDLKSFGGNPVPVRVRPWAPSDSLI